MRLIHALLLMIAYRTQSTQTRGGGSDSPCSAPFRNVRLEKALEAAYRHHAWRRASGGMDAERQGLAGA